MGDVVAEGVAALQTPILQVGNPALPSMGVTARGYVREAQANNNGTQGDDCNVQCCPAKTRQPQSTENPSFGGGHKVLPLWLPLWLLLWQTVHDVMPVNGGAVPVMSIGAVV